MALDRTAASGLLKKFYLGPLRNQVNMGTPLLAEIEKRSEMVSGEEVRIPLQLGRNEAVGARLDGQNVQLPTAQEASWKQAIVTTKKLYGHIIITLPAMKSMRNQEGAFMPAIEASTKTVSASLRDDVNRQVASNDSLGRGALAATAANAATNTLVLSGVDATTFRKLRVGMIIDIVDITNDAVVAIARKITAINTATGTITIDGTTVATTVNHRIVRSGSWKAELIGIDGIVAATGSLHGVDPAVAGSEPWAATVIAHNAALTELVMHQALDEVDIQSGSEEIRILCEHTQRRKLGAIQTTFKQFVNTMELKGGYKTITFNGYGIIVDKYIAPSIMYFLSMGNLSLQEESDWEWMDDDGNILSRLANTPNYEAAIYKFCELVTDRRNSHAKVTGLTV